MTEFLDLFVSIARRNGCTDCCLNAGSLCGTVQIQRSVYRAVVVKKRGVWCGVVWWLRHGISAFVQCTNGKMVHECMYGRLLSVTTRNADRQCVIPFL